MKVVWSSRAEDRVLEIALFIAQDRPQAAIAWARSLFEAVEALADQPYMGEPGRDIMTPGIRELVIGEYRVFYEVGENVEVHSVRRGSELIDEEEFRED